MKNNSYPKGHFIKKWMVLGMVIFSGFGIPLSIAIGNNGLIGVGPAIGVIAGIVIGSFVEKKHERDGLIRQLNDEELKKQRNEKIVGWILVIAGILVLVTIF